MGPNRKRTYDLEAREARDGPKIIIPAICHRKDHNMKPETLQKTSLAAMHLHIYATYSSCFKGIVCLFLKSTSHMKLQSAAFRTMLLIWCPVTRKRASRRRYVTQGCSMLVLHVQCSVPAAQRHPESSSYPQQAPQEPSCSLRKFHPGNRSGSESRVSVKIYQVFLPSFFCSVVHLLLVW